VLGRRLAARYIGWGEIIVGLVVVLETRVLVSRTKMKVLVLGIWS